MRRKPLVQVVAGVVVTVFAAGIWATGDVPKWGWLRFFSLAVWIAVAALFVWDKLVWCLPWVQKFRVVPRDIRGTWKGTLTTQWIDETTGKAPAAKEVFLVIRQEAFTVSAVLLTDESQSTSSLAQVVEDPTGALLSYIYLNRPQSKFEDRGRMHPGAASLDLIGRPVTRLVGRYWTDRNSRGELEFTEKRRRYVEGYAEAVMMFAEKATDSPSADATPQTGVQTDDGGVRERQKS